MERIWTTSRLYLGSSEGIPIFVRLIRPRFPWIIPLPRWPPQFLQSIIINSGLMIQLPEIEYVKHSMSRAIRRRYQQVAVEGNLPDRIDTNDQITDKGALADIPELQHTIAATNDLVFIVLETGDGTPVIGEDLLDVGVFGVPNSKGRVGSG